MTSMMQIIHYEKRHHLTIASTAKITGVTTDVNIGMAPIYYKTDKN